MTQLAMDVLGPEPKIVEQFALETDGRSKITGEHEKYTTNLPGVFAAGDMRRGQLLVVWAMPRAHAEADEMALAVRPPRGSMAA
jgi:glutamate synthase (NADPH) small chain